MRWEIDFGDRPWHRWFAWHPVRLSGTNSKVWWEWVNRQTTNCQGYRIHQYRPLGEAEDARRPTREPETTKENQP